MDKVTITIFFYASILVILVLSLCIVYVVYAYRKLLDKYTNLSVKTDRNEIQKKINIDTTRFVNQKLDDAISQASEEAVKAISRSAESVAKNIREKTIEKLQEEEKGQEMAVESEYDEVKLEIENYKAKKFEEIKIKANEVLSKVAAEALSGEVDTKNQENLIIKALENAKRSNIF